MSDGKVDWHAMLKAARAIPVSRTKADSCRCRFDTKSGWKPVLMRLSDGSDWVVKALRPAGAPGHDGLSAGRTMFNEHVAGCLAAHLLAPVSEVTLVDIPEEVKNRYLNLMALVQPGTAHGSRFLSGCCKPTPKHLIQYAGEQINRTRFAALAVFIGWTAGSDKEFLYDRHTHAVHCIDLGNFFGRPDWTVATLNKLGRAEVDSTLLSECSLTAEELAEPLRRVRAVRPDQIAAAIAAPPDKWEVPDDERVALANFLVRRQSEIAA